MQSLAIIFSFLTICYHVAGYINIVIQAAVSIPALIQIVYLGVYRFSWYGKACSVKEASLYTQGHFLKVMLAAQVLLFLVYHALACAGTSVKRHAHHDKDKEDLKVQASVVRANSLR